MKKHLFFLSFMLLSLFFSCEKTDGKLDSSSSRLQIYGTEIPITHGVIWQSNKNTIIEKVEYVWEDKYLDEQSNQKIDKVVGFFRSNNKIETGNFMLSLYGEGLNYIPELTATKGEGALVSLHLSSSDLTQLAPGKYKFDNSKLADTFVGYLSTTYNMGGKVGNLATITGGEVNISKEGDVYIVDLNASLSDGLITSCRYKGKLDNCIVSQPKMAMMRGIAIHGLVPTIVRRTWTKPSYDDVPDSYETTLDVANKAFLSIASGVPQTSAEYKPSVEIALKIDTVTREFTFISPIKARATLGHKAENNFPCHTKYMRAPATFNANDYDNIEKNGINFTVVEEDVKFSVANFKPGYVFFDAGNGASGVIYVKEVSPSFEVSTDMYYGYILRYDILSEQLICDIKSITNYGNPKIR